MKDSSFLLSKKVTLLLDTISNKRILSLNSLIRASFSVRIYLNKSGLTESQFMTDSSVFSDGRRYMSPSVLLVPTLTLQKKI